MLTLSRKPTTTKDREAAYVTRMIRRSGGIMGRREARQAHEMMLGRRSSDFIGTRRPGDFSTHFAEVKSLYIRRRANGIPCDMITGLGAFCVAKFFHYGPSSGMWPGDSLVWDTSVEFTHLPEDHPRRRGAWIVKRGNG